MSMFLEVLLSVLVLAGAGLVLLGSFGLVKLPDFYTRLHAPTKATTLGMGSILIASMILNTVQKGAFSAHELLITVFLFITAPITAHMLAKAALHLEIHIHKGTQNRRLHLAARARSNPKAEQEQTP